MEVFHFFFVSTYLPRFLYCYLKLGSECFRNENGCTKRFETTVHFLRMFTNRTSIPIVIIFFYPTSKCTYYPSYSTNSIMFTNMK